MESPLCDAQLVRFDEVGGIELGDFDKWPLSGPSLKGLENGKALGATDMVMGDDSDEPS